jgi:hypothetical protein
VASGGPRAIEILKDYEFKADKAQRVYYSFATTSAGIEF